MLLLLLLLLLTQNVADPSVIARGEQIFAQHCSVGYCHGVGGAAGAGPRLRGRQLDRGYVLQVTRDGIPQSAMPGWKDRLRDEDIRAVVAYVLSLATATDPVPDPNAQPPGVSPAAFVTFAGPPQAKRGHDLFFDATRGTRCATCHASGGRGISIGPDLAAVAREYPGQLFPLMRSRRSRHVLTATLESGETFPALQISQSEQWVKLYDLSSPLPVLRTVERSEIASIEKNTTWEHRSAVDDYSDPELEAIVPYLTWEGSRDQ